MIQPMRTNVLIDAGPLYKLSEIIEIPESCQGIGARGTVVNLGPKCVVLNKSDIGKEVMFNIVRGSGRIINPESSQRYGLKKTWHLLAPESKCYLKFV